MAYHEISKLPSENLLKSMTSEEIESLSAELTSAKSKYLEDYKEKQERLQVLLSEKLKTEQEERIAKDPEYWNKHQGVGAPLPRK